MARAWPGRAGIGPPWTLGQNTGSVGVHRAEVALPGDGVGGSPPDRGDAHPHPVGAGLRHGGVARTCEDLRKPPR